MILQKLRALDCNELGGAATSVGRKLIDEVKELGHYPRSVYNPRNDQEKREKGLARRIRGARMDQTFSPAELAELDAFQQTSIHPHGRDRSAQLLEKAQEPPNPMEAFADEAENRLDQCLLLLSSGHRTRDLQRELKQYCFEQTLCFNLSFCDQC